MRELRSAGLVALALILVTACSTLPDLVGRSAVVPDGIDLSGRWTLRGTADLPVVADPGIQIGRSGSGRPAANRQHEGAAVRVFLEMGQQLKVTQTAHSLFVSFDRAIVEEFTFGENRIVTVGPIEARRVSGWEGGRFIVETMDSDRALLTETWYLDSIDATLVRDVRITRGDREELAVHQVFDRS